MYVCSKLKDWTGEESEVRSYVRRKKSNAAAS